MLYYIALDSGHCASGFGHWALGVCGTVRHQHGTVQHTNVQYSPITALVERRTKADETGCRLPGADRAETRSGPPSGCPRRVALASRVPVLPQAQRSAASAKPKGMRDMMVRGNRIPLSSALVLVVGGADLPYPGSVLACHGLFS